MHFPKGAFILIFGYLCAIFDSGFISLITLEFTWMEILFYNDFFYGQQQLQQQQQHTIHFGLEIIIIFQVNLFRSLFL